MIGHRGAKDCAPENTLAGLRKAKALDCRWVEFDVRLTADNRLILRHDDRLSGTTDGRGRVSALPLAAIRRCDAGIRFGPAFAGEQVPTLEEAVALLAELGLGANVELKAVPGREMETARVAVDILDRLWPARLPPPLISSFRHEALGVARELAPRFPRGALFRAVPEGWRAVAERFGCATVNVARQGLRPGVVAEIRDAGYACLVYTVNDAARARQLFSWGVTSVFSDVPHIIIAGTGSANVTCQGSLG